MKGRYGKGHMMIYGSTMPGASSVTRDGILAEHLTERAKHKLKVIDWHRANEENVSLTARHFGYARKTIHAWLKAYRLKGPIGLNERSRSPKKKRVPETSGKAVMLICKTRKQYPAWSKYKIAEVLKRDHNIEISASTVGRVMQRRGLIAKKKSVKRQKAALKPKRRFPQGFSISQAGDMVQMDTKHIMLPGGRKHYQFTAIDVLGKQRILEAYPSPSSRNGAKFLKRCVDEFPFPIRNVQTDNGSEFLKEFEALCTQLDIPHYFIYPRKKEQNAYVERSHGSDEREFYRLGNAWQDIVKMNEALRVWQDIWNNFRPHEALDYKTPNQYFEELKSRNLATKDVIILQT